MLPYGPSWGTHLSDLTLLFGAGSPFSAAFGKLVGIFSEHLKRHPVHFEEGSYMTRSLRKRVYGKLFVDFYSLNEFEGVSLGYRVPFSLASAHHPSARWPVLATSHTFHTDFQTLYFGTVIVSTRLR